VTPLQDTISTGCPSLDQMLNGGIPVSNISLVYGEAETGKTTLAIQCAVNCARKGQKVIFIDTDNSFSAIRLSQIAYYDLDKLSPMITLLRPNTFQEQILAMDHLEEYSTEKVGLIVVDTFTSLYRAEFGENSKGRFTLNRELNRQLACLSQIAKTYKKTVFITSQVRSILVEAEVNLEPVATRVLNFWSDIVIRLKPTGRANVVNAILEKHPKHKRLTSCYFMIEETGIHACHH
jgi:DNA repair protein RadB